MKFGQVIEHNKRTFFLKKNHSENEARRLVLRLFLFLQKVLYEVNASGVELIFNMYILQ